MAKLEGKVAIVTGAGSGIGAATAQHMAHLGAKVVVAGRNAESLSRIEAAIAAAGGRAISVVADIGEELQVAALAAHAKEAFGRIDILVANAAITDPGFMARDGLVTAMDVETWDRTFQINVRGPMLCCKYIVPHMLEAGGGSIIFSSSGKGSRGDFDHMAYGASKAALNSLMRYVAVQYGKQGVRANAVIIGLVLSDALKTSFPQPLRIMIEEHHLTPYLGEPDHIAAAIAFLASDEAAFITGAEVPVDGGVISHTPLYADFLRMHTRESGH